MPKDNFSPTAGVTEYYDEFCLNYKNRRRAPAKITIFPCKKTEEVQPVGGRAQAHARELMAKRMKPIIEAPSHVATHYVSADHGCHRVGPQWRDNRWSGAMRADASSLYDPADRDPRNRPNFYVYQSTRIDPLWTPVKPMACPDVHKLRYMHGTYVTPDDWY